MYATKNFLSRSEQQGAEMTLVQEKLSGYGVVTQYSGDASDHLDKVDVRRARTGLEALAARFRPNQIMVAGGGRSALCEVKSESRGRCNFAVEVDSFTATEGRTTQRCR